MTQKVKNLYNDIIGDQLPGYSLATALRDYDSILYSLGGNEEAALKEIAYDMYFVLKRYP